MQKASGSNWQGPILSRILEDPYSAVRFITARSLKFYEGLEDLEFDFLGESSSWKTSVDQALAAWKTNQQEQNQLAEPRRVLFKSSSEFDALLIPAMLSKRVNRSMDLQ